MVELDLTKVSDNSVKVDDVTLAEVYETLSKEESNLDVAIESSPFPHIELTKPFGAVIIFDADSGWLDGKITITTLSVRCLFNTHKYEINLDSPYIKDFSIKKLESDHKVQALVHIKKNTLISEASDRILLLVAHFNEVSI